MKAKVRREEVVSRYDVTSRAKRLLVSVSKRKARLERELEDLKQLELRFGGLP